ncbi:MAG: alpha/beta hydrolase [Dehalococcoidia bacterium]|nr:alpha/beta hydrolase [Dehalococcoidia bacterium]
MKLIFIHGSGACGDVWYYQKQQFIEAEAIDLPGHPRGGLCYSVEEYADWLHAYIKQKKYQDAVLAGHSLGGGIALMHAYKYQQDLRGIILVGSGARLRVLPLILEAIKAKLDDREGWMRELVAPFYGTVNRKALDIILPRLAEIGPAVQLNDFYCCDKFDIMDNAGLINIPALAIVGDQDNMTPPKYSQYLVKNMQNCRMTVVEGGSHLAFLEKPDQVNQAIAGFIKELGG